MYVSWRTLKASASLFSLEHRTRAGALKNRCNEAKEAAGSPPWRKSQHKWWDNEASSASRCIVSAPVTLSRHACDPGHYEISILIAFIFQFDALSFVVAFDHTTYRWLHDSKLFSDISIRELRIFLNQFETLIFGWCHFSNFQQW